MKYTDYLSRHFKMRMYFKLAFHTYTDRRKVIGFKFINYKWSWWPRGKSMHQIQVDVHLKRRLLERLEIKGTSMIINHEY